jgi:hypothetical protein
MGARASIVPALRHPFAEKRVDPYARRPARGLRYSDPMSAIANPFRYAETSRSDLDPETLLPVQFADQRTKQGEKRLMLAVLEKAIGTLQRNLHAKTSRGRRQFREAEEWIVSPDTSWMFSFETICHTLGLDPEYLRGGLERMKERRPASWARVYRFRRVNGRRTSVAPTRVRFDEGAERRRVS